MAGMGQSEVRSEEFFSETFMPIETQTLGCFPLVLFQAFSKELDHKQFSRESIVPSWILALHTVASLTMLQ